MKTIEYRKPVYAYEIDAGQHVSNIAYIRWMEIVRLEFLARIGLPVHEIRDRGFMPVLTSTEIRYRKPLFIGDEVRIVMWLSDLRSASAKMSFEFYNQKGDVVATGEQAGLFVDVESHRPHRLKEQERSLFEPYVEDD